MLKMLCGTNSFMRKKVQQDIIQKFTEQHGHNAVEKIDGEEATFENMQEAIQGLSFLTPNKLVILQAPSAQKEFQEKYQNLFGTDLGDTEVIIVEPKPAKIGTASCRERVCQYV